MKPLQIEGLRANLPPAEQKPINYPDRDDLPSFEREALDKFVVAMATKLYAKYIQGYSGFETASEKYLNSLLQEHLVKDDPVDVANFCAFLHYNGQRVTPPAEPLILDLKLTCTEQEELERLREEVKQSRDLRDALKQQAQLWKQEARTQASIVKECYQLCTGSTGEQGDWNGAEPVRKVMAELAQLRTENVALKERVKTTDSSDDLQKDVEPVYWEYGLGTVITEGIYSHWEARVTKYKPNVPLPALRNLTPLYTRANLPPAEKEELERLREEVKAARIASDGWRYACEKSDAELTQLRAELNKHDAWLSQAHVVCFDLGVKAGHIEDRLFEAIGAVQQLRAELAALKK